MRAIGKIMGAVLVVGLLSGCSDKVCKVTMPSFPKPDKKVLGKIREIGDDGVDAWMKELYVFNKKYKVITE